MKNENTWKSRKKMSKLLGTLRKKGKKGTYYYRVQIASGERREFSLKTSDPDEALQQAAAMDAVIDAFDIGGNHPRSGGSKVGARL